MTDFETACLAARTTAHGLLARDVEAEEIANAFIVQGLAVWQADVGERAGALEILDIWVRERDRAAEAPDKTGRATDA